MLAGLLACVSPHKFKNPGIIFAIISVFLGALATIMYKPIMLLGVSPTLIGLIESLTIVIILTFTRSWYIDFSSVNKNLMLPIIYASACQAIGSMSFVFGLYHLDPVTFSFLNRNNATCSIVMGYFLLSERHNTATWLFIFTAIIGTILLCFADIKTINPIGLFFSFSFCLSLSTRNFILRKYKSIPVTVNIFYGYLLSFIFLGVFSYLYPTDVFTVTDFWIITKICLVATIAILGTSFFFQLAFKYEKLSVISPIRLFSPFLVIIYFGLQMKYNYPPLKIVGIGVISLSMLILAYSYLVNPKES